MAFFRASSGSGGGSMTETLLWTNSDPTSTFAAQTITLSDDINNYDYIKVTYKMNTGASAKVISALVSVEDFLLTSGSASITCALGSFYGTSATASRCYRYASDTSIRFYGGFTNASTSAANGIAIPTYIYGVTL